MFPAAAKATARCWITLNFNHGAISLFCRWTYSWHLAGNKIPGPDEAQDGCPESGVPYALGANPGDLCDCVCGVDRGYGALP